MSIARQPAVAGQFYPGNPQELKSTVEHYLQAEAPIAEMKQPPKALIVPHAGYIYSGATAGKAFQLLKPFSQQIHNVVLLGPSHRVGFEGMALSEADYYVTPLGRIELIKEVHQPLMARARIGYLEQAHTYEHSLEVQLPFLQQVLDDFRLLPIVVGDCPKEEVAKVIEYLWDEPGTLFVISSDLSHYLTYDQARALDQKTCHAIENLDADHISYEQACGRNPVKGLLECARHHNVKVTTVDLCNSGDTAGDKSRVVGYGAWCFTEAA